MIPARRPNWSTRRCNGAAGTWAGADCVYPILALEEETVRKLVDELPGPVNALLSPQGPSLATLAELGVARVSLGPYLFRAAEDWLRGELGNLSEQAGGDR